MNKDAEKRLEPSVSLLQTHEIMKCGHGIPSAYLMRTTSSDQTAMACAERSLVKVVIAFADCYSERLRASKWPGTRQQYAERALALIM